MTHPALIERITRSLAYMLRHQPEQFDLELDEYGFGDLEDVVQALNERLGEPVEEEDVHEAVLSGDRMRYEIKNHAIRALYGHSIEVKPGEPSKPPDLMYVGVSSSDAERARRFGLRAGRRRFLHLALAPEDALETGRRTSREYVVITVHALDAWEEGINFYDRKALFLSDPIPTHFLEVGEVHTDGFGELDAGHGGAGGRRAPHHDRARRGGGRQADRPARFAPERPVAADEEPEEDQELDRGDAEQELEVDEAPVSEARAASSPSDELRAPARGGPRHEQRPRPERPHGAARGTSPRERPEPQRSRPAFDDARGAERGGDTRGAERGADARGLERGAPAHARSSGHERPRAPHADERRDAPRNAGSEGQRAGGDARRGGREEFGGRRDAPRSDAGRDAPRGSEPARREDAQRAGPARRDGPRERFDERRPTGAQSPARVEREPAREQRTEDARRPAPERQAQPARDRDAQRPRSSEQPADSGSDSFGVGVFEAQSPRKPVARPSAPPPRKEPEREQPRETPRAPDDERGGFGAGI